MERAWLPQTRVKSRVMLAPFTTRQKRGLPPDPHGLATVAGKAIGWSLTPVISEARLVKGRLHSITYEATPGDAKLRSLRRQLYIQYRLAYRALKRARHRWTERYHALKSGLRQTYRDKDARVSVHSVEIRVFFADSRRRKAIQADLRYRRKLFVKLLRKLQDDGQVRNMSLPIKSIRLSWDEYETTRTKDEAGVRRQIRDLRSGHAGAWTLGPRGKRLSSQGWVLPGPNFEFFGSLNGLTIAREVIFVRVKEIKTGIRSWKVKQRKLRSFDRQKYLAAIYAWKAKNRKPRSYREFLDEDTVRDLRAKITNAIYYHQCSHHVSSVGPIAFRRGTLRCQYTQDEGAFWHAGIVGSGWSDSHFFREDDNPVTTQATIALSQELTVPAVEGDALHMPIGLFCLHHWQRWTESYVRRWGHWVLAKKWTVGLTCRTLPSVPHPSQWAYPGMGPGTHECELDNPAEAMGSIRLTDDTPALRPLKWRQEAQHKLIKLQRLELPGRSTWGDESLGRSLVELKDFGPQLAVLADFLGWTQKAKLNAKYDSLVKLMSIPGLSARDTMYKQRVLESLNRAGQNSLFFRRAFGLDTASPKALSRRWGFISRYIRPLSRKVGVPLRTAVALYFFYKFGVEPTINDVNRCLDDIEGALGMCRKTLQRMLSYAKVKQDASLFVRLTPDPVLMAGPTTVTPFTFSTSVPAVAPFQVPTAELRRGYGFEALPAVGTFPTLPNYFTAYARALSGRATHTKTMAAAERALFWHALRSRPEAIDVCVAKCVRRMLKGSRVFARFSAADLKAALKDDMVVKWGNLVKPAYTTWEVLPMSFILDWCFTTREVMQAIEQCAPWSTVDYAGEGVWASIKQALDIVLPPGLDVTRTVNMVAPSDRDSPMIVNSTALGWLRTLERELGWTPSTNTPNWASFVSNLSRGETTPSRTWVNQAWSESLFGGLLDVDQAELETPLGVVTPGEFLHRGEMTAVSWDTFQCDVSYDVKPTQQSEPTVAELKVYQRGPLADDYIARFVPQLRLNLSPEKLLSVAGLLVQALPVRHAF